MDSNTKKRCTNLIENRNVIKSAAKWDYTTNQWLAALLCTVNDTRITEERLKNTRSLVKENTGITSRFRGTFSLPVAASLSCFKNRASVLKSALRFDEALKAEGFKRSDYTVLTSVMIGQSTSSTGISSLARRSKMFYDAMRENHKLRISSKDYSTAIILATTDLSPEEVIGEGERCYEILKNYFPGKTAALSLGYILAMSKERAEIKCQKVIDIYEELKLRGFKYGTNYELPSLGVMAFYPQSAGIIASDLAEVAEYLGTQKGFGLFSISKAQRLMFAGGLIGQDYQSKELSQSMSLTVAVGTTAMIIATEAAIIAAIAASSAAAAASSGSN